MSSNMIYMIKKLAKEAMSARNCWSVWNFLGKCTLLVLVLLRIAVSFNRNKLMIDFY